MKKFGAKKIMIDKNNDSFVNLAIFFPACF